jgi:hypothetical protein
MRVPVVAQPAVAATGGQAWEEPLAVVVAAVDPAPEEPLAAGLVRAAVRVAVAVAAVVLLRAAVVEEPAVVLLAAEPLLAAVEMVLPTPLLVRVLFLRNAALRQAAALLLQQSQNPSWLS